MHFLFSKSVHFLFSVLKDKVFITVLFHAMAYDRQHYNALLFSLLNTIWIQYDSELWGYITWSAYKLRILLENAHFDTIPGLPRGNQCSDLNSDSSFPCVSYQWNHNVRSFLWLAFSVHPHLQRCIYVLCTVIVYSSASLRTFPLLDWDLLWFSILLANIWVIPILGVLWLKHFLPYAFVCLLRIQLDFIRHEIEYDCRNSRLKNKGEKMSTSL